MKNKILVIGSGAREHAIVRALIRSPQEKEIYCLASNMNPGIAELSAEILIGNFNDPEFVVSYAKKRAQRWPLSGLKIPWQMELLMLCGILA